MHPRGTDWDLIEDNLPVNVACQPGTLNYNKQRGREQRSP
jgi:hypothetical protein